MNMYIYRMCIFTSIDYVRMGTKKSVIVEFVYSGGTVDELLHVNNASKREGNMFNSYNHLEDNCLFDNEINNSIFRNNSNGHQCNQQSSPASPSSSSSSSLSLSLSNREVLINENDNTTTLTAVDSNNPKDPLESLNRRLIENIAMLEI